MGERVRTAGLRGEDPVRPAGRCRIGARLHGATLEPRYGLRRSLERAGPARGLGVRIELLPLEDGRAPEPLAALHAAADGESRGDAVHRELRRGACRHGDRAGPPPSMARPAGGVAGVRGRPPAGARHRSERPADCGRSIYLSRRPRMGDPGRCRPVVLLAPLHELDDRGTGDVGACRYCHGCRYRVGSPHLEPGPGLAGLGEAVDPCRCR